MRILKSGLLAGAMLAGLAAPALAEPVEYTFDPAHTVVTFSVDHMGFSAFPAYFAKVSGKASIDRQAPASSSVTASIDATSIQTRTEKLNGELEEQVFKAKDHPTIEFKSTALEPTGDTTAKLTGDLTIAGVTKPVVLEVKLYGQGKHPFKPVDMLGFQADGSFKRSDFGLTAFAPVVGDEVTVHISAEMAHETAAK